MTLRMVVRKGHMKMHYYKRLSCAILVAPRGIAAAAQCTLVTGANDIYNCSSGTTTGLGT